MSGRVFVIGSYVAGLTMRTHHLPVPGETLVGTEFDDGPGGKGSNQAVQAARLGATTVMIGCIGTDALADVALALWHREGVDIRRVRRISGSPTGVAFILLDAAGNNSIVVYPGANDALAARDVEELAAEVGDGDVVVAQLEVPLVAAEAAMRVGRARGATTILNPAPARAEAARMLPDVDVLTPNATEGRILLGLDPRAHVAPAELAQRIRELGSGTVVLTLGEEGAVIAHPDGTERIDPVAVEVVDTTGAGDAFTGTLAAEIAAGRSIGDAARAAAVSGALACTAMGVIPALPDRGAINERLRTLTA